MPTKQTLIQSLRRYGSDFISHPVSRGISDIEAAGELMLEAALALAEPAEQPVAWLYEDTLPPEYPYDAMFPYSKVNGVRMFPVFAPQPAKREPNAFGVLFAVEQAIQNGDCPWQIEQAFDEYEAERKNGITKE